MSDKNKFKGTPENPKVSRSERIENHKLKRAKLVFMISLYFFATCGILSTGLLIRNFIITHDFRSPVVFQAPILAKVSKNKIKSPLGSQKKVTMIDKPLNQEKLLKTQPEGINSIVSKIYRLESSSGKNDSCLSKGLFNGYGYMQSTYYWKCYESHEEVVSLVTNWVQDKLDRGYSVPELLCLYNRGVKETTCEYYQKYLTI